MGAEWYSDRAASCQAPPRRSRKEVSAGQIQAGGPKRMWKRAQSLRPKWRIEHFKGGFEAKLC